MYKITNLDTGEVKSVCEGVNIREAILLLFDRECCLSKTKEESEIWSAINSREYFKVEIELTVTLNYDDLVNIPERMCKEDDTLSRHVGVAWVEYLLCEAIRHLKGVDFFKEEQRLIDVRGENKNES